MTEERVAYTLPPYTLYNADVLDDEGQAARVWDFDSIREAVYFACHFRAANPAKTVSMWVTGTGQKDAVIVVSAARDW